MVSGNALNGNRQEVESPVKALVEVSCPLCGVNSPRVLFAGADTVFGFTGQWQVVRCAGCGMMYTNPQIKPQELTRFYPKEYSAHTPERPRPDRDRERDPWDRLQPAGRKRLLDVGCGSGGYLLRQRAQGWLVTGVEPSASAVNAARAAGLEVLEGTIPGASLPDSHFEAITVLAALPCVPRPMETLKALRAMLVAGGTLIVSAHNAGSAAAEKLGAYWQGWDLPRGLNHFTPATLRRMVAEAGFGDVRLEWRRRSSRWRHGARAMANAGEAGPWWRMVAASRTMARIAAAIHSRGERSDEIIAVAGG